MPWHGQPVELLAAIMQVASVMRSVEGEIAEVNDDVGGVRADVAEQASQFAAASGAAGDR